MSKAKFSAADVAAAVEEFETYIAPRFVPAGGRNGDIKVYGENPNERKAKPIIYDEDDERGILQKLSDSDFGNE